MKTCNSKSKVLSLFSFSLTLLPIKFSLQIITFMIFIHYEHVQWAHRLGLANVLKCLEKYRKG